MMMYIIIGIACLVGIIVVVLLLPNSGKQQQKGQKYRFELSAGGGRKITFADPFDNFLVYGGANSGKTKSIGKPLLSQYIQAGFAGFVYNYKDFDLARTAVHLVKKHNYPYGCFQISFTDMERTHRTNPIRPSVVKNETLFLQLMDDMMTAYQGKDGKRPHGRRKKRSSWHSSRNWQGKNECEKILGWRLFLTRNSGKN